MMSRLFFEHARCSSLSNSGMNSVATPTAPRLQDRWATATNLHWWLGGHPRQPLQQQRSHSSTVFRCLGPCHGQCRASYNDAHLMISDRILRSAAWGHDREDGFGALLTGIIVFLVSSGCDCASPLERDEESGMPACLCGRLFPDPMPIKRVVNCAAKSHLCDYCTEMVQILELELFFICILNFFYTSLSTHVPAWAN